MQVTKRNGEKQEVKFDKILKRVTRISKNYKNTVDSVLVAQRVVNGLYDGVTTKELDQLAIETAYSLTTKHPDYDKLASRLAISALHKETESTFSGAMKKLYENKDALGNNRPLISDNFYAFVKKHSAVLDSTIDYSRDFLIDYFGFKTLEKSYLLKTNEFINNKPILKIVERPQHMWMRVAVGIHLDDIDAAINTYHLLSTLKGTHATPTLFNAGTKDRANLASCFLLAMKEDSIVGIYDTLKDIAVISQSAGGIGVSISNIRSKGSPIYGTNGTSNGIIPMLKVYNETTNYVDQGGGKRKGSCAAYIEPWHADIFEFLDLRKNNGKEELRARNLNLALWTNDLFFKRVKEDGIWSLMDPNICKGLQDSYGEEFDKLYCSYEDKKLFVKQIKARELWSKVVEAMIETGQPYILSKDNANIKSNQKNLGTIKSSNLCAEIIEYTSPDEIAVCNLASISLPSCIEIKGNKKVFNFSKLGEISKTFVENLNKVIDLTNYPTDEAKKSNSRHRPIGLGVQGLADVFNQLRLPWESEEALKLNEDIFETIYYNAVDTSCKLAEKYGSYDTFKGSPASEGKLQFDLWGDKPLSDRYDWEELKQRVIKNGLRNSLLLCCMPTAGTSQILGNVESIEPPTSNIYKRLTLSGEFIQINKYLVDDLISLGIWNEELRQKIIANEGSVQNIKEIPDDIKVLYKTVWEISQKTVINMAAARGKYICQSQSMNLFFAEPNTAKITSAIFYGWEKGLKTLCYYTRAKAAREAIKFTVDKQIENSLNKEVEEQLMCSLDNDECKMCSA